MRRGSEFRAPVVLSLAVLALSACAGGTGGTAAGSSSAAPASELTVAVDHDGTGPTPAREYRLTCGARAGGDLPDAAAACRHLSRMTDPFAPLPTGVACAEVWSGPETARVSGVWQGEQVRATFSRTNGCRTAQWERLGPLFP